MLKLGWKAGTEQYAPGELLDYAVAADAAGFDTVDASDHFHPWSEQGHACFVWSWLGAVAAKTGKITLGTGVTCPILRYHPSIIAQAAATIACLASGRFYLGVGTGEALNEYSSVAQWPDYAERQARLAEAIGLMRALWTGEKITRKGAYYECQGAKLYTRPDSPIPIYISSMVPDSAHFAGQYGDGLITVGGEEPDTYAEMLKNFEQGAREAGKDPSTLPRMIELSVDWSDDADKVIELRKQYWAGAMVPAMFTHRIHTPKLSETNGKVVGSEVIRQSTCISTDAAEHVKNARRYIDMGFDYLIFHSASDQKAMIEAYGRDVLPKLRQRSKAPAAEKKQTA
jgi:coenzyme F420-dependent glucose-6-phosphate dehydrogenase